MRTLRSTSVLSSHSVPCAWLRLSCSLRQIGVINIDAHLDVRPLKHGEVHSGSPFRLLLEDPRFAEHLVPLDSPDQNSALKPHRFIEFAAQGSQCSQAHVDYLLEAGRGRSTVYWLSHLRCREYTSPLMKSRWPEPNLPIRQSIRDQFADILDFMSGRSLFVSFDLDAVAGDDAPGVSCPGTVGLTSQEALWVCYAAGANPRVKLFDLSEFNPKSQSHHIMAVQLHVRTHVLIHSLTVVACSCVRLSVQLMRIARVDSLRICSTSSVSASPRESRKPRQPHHQPDHHHPHR
jgi:hypothetical protein